MKMIAAAFCISICNIHLLPATGKQPPVAPFFPPGWLPVATLEAHTPSWKEFRSIEDRVHLYFPNGDKKVRGIFLCFVFHSSDPRELARLWDFALVTIPWKMMYDLGQNDKRSGRYKDGHPAQDMGLMLRYLDEAAEQTGHPELSSAPIVAWMGQNGSHTGGDLFNRAPERIIAWGDSFPNRLRQYPEMTKAVPFAFAWEISKKELREGTRKYRDDEVFDHNDLSARANTYGFGHGIYSKYNYFASYIDRCIRLRLTNDGNVRPVNRKDGWLGDFDPISEWNPILPASDANAAAFKYPCWFPDRYSAHMWRSYHSANPPLKLTGPVIEYRKKDGKWGGPECGLGYGGGLSSRNPHTFSASVKGDADFSKIQFYSGDILLGERNEAPWTLDNVKLSPGLHALYAVGIDAKGAQSASRPAFAIVFDERP